MTQLIISCKVVSLYMKQLEQITFIGAVGGPVLQNIANAFEETGLADSATAFTVREALGSENNLFLEAAGSSVWTYGRGVKALSSLQALPLQELVIISPEDTSIMRRLGGAALMNGFKQHYSEKNYHEILTNAHSLLRALGDSCFQVAEDIIDRQTGYQSMFNMLADGKLWSSRISYVHMSNGMMPAPNDIQRRIMKKAKVNYYELPGKRGEIFTDPRGVFERVSRTISGSAHSAA